MREADSVSVWFPFDDMEGIFWQISWKTIVDTKQSKLLPSHFTYVLKVSVSGCCPFDTKLLEFGCFTHFCRKISFKMLSLQNQTQGDTPQKIIWYLCWFLSWWTLYMMESMGQKEDKRLWKLLPFSLSLFLLGLFCRKSSLQSKTITTSTIKARVVI